MPPRNTAPRRIQLKRDLARRLRSSPTDAERKLWNLLRGKQIAGLRFRRQQPVGPYVVDFFCPAAKLIVELDGDQHGGDTKAAYDAARTNWLKDRGYMVLRIPNHAVLKGNPIDLICRAIDLLLPLPERPSAVRPSLKGRVE